MGPRVCDFDYPAKPDSAQTRCQKFADPLGLSVASVTGARRLARAMIAQTISESYIDERTRTLWSVTSILVAHLPGPGEYCDSLRAVSASFSGTSALFDSTSRFAGRHFRRAAYWLARFFQGDNLFEPQYIHPPRARQREYAPHNVSRDGVKMYYTTFNEYSQ